ncbi:MAG TPA: 3-phosphoshikimate 1-carboxyvinyltransferase [Acidimicrobiales bacterium]|nr:3-phosphoshikimate 1-carboxyvinyltransferase [Acidimicrobiales bacterium]
MTAPRAVSPLAGPLDTTITVPGSKSHTNRALACAGLASGTSTLRGALEADDTVVMRRAVERLGATIEILEAGTTLVVGGTNGRPAPVPTEIDAHLSGTTSRFVLGMAAAGSAPVLVDGLDPLRARPMGPSLDALRELGASVAEHGTPGHLPVEVTGPVRSRAVAVDASASSQFVSGLLLAAPAFPAGIDLTLTGEVVSWPYLEFTVSVMAAFGAEVERPERRRFVVPSQHYVGRDLRIEGDASSASYFFAAAAASGGRITVEGIGSDCQQGDVGFLDVLSAMGATVERGPSHVTVQGPDKLRGIEVDMADISDTAQTLAAIAPLADGPTRITGIGFIRRKETDRIAAVVSELRRCGVDASEEDDGWMIRPGPVGPAVVQTYDDHRMAMSFAVLGLLASGIEIADPDCVNKTFPAFWAVLDQLR